MTNVKVLRKMICAECKSEDVVVDAWAEWDIPSQQWALRTAFDNGFCIDCENACDIDEIELTDDEARDYSGVTFPIIAAHVGLPSATISKACELASSNVCEPVGNQLSVNEIDETLARAGLDVRGS